MVSTRKSGNSISAAAKAVEETPRSSRARKAKQSEKMEPEVESSATNTVQTTPYSLRKRKEAPTRYEDEQIPPKRRRAPATNKRKTPPTKAAAPKAKRRSLSATRKSTTTPEPASDSVTISPRSVSRVTPNPEPNDTCIQKIKSNPNEKPDEHQDWLLRSQLDTVPESVASADVICKLVAYWKKAKELKQLGKDYVKGLEVEGLPTMGADSSLKAEALPILKHLTIRMLHVFATSSIRDLVTMIADKKSEAGREFGRVKKLFEDIKEVYASKDAFLKTSEQGNLGPEAVGILRNANLATFVASCFGSGEVGFYHLNEYFLDTFVNDGSRLLKQQAGLLLDLKTQAYISAISTWERPKGVVLDEMFPENLEEKLIGRRAGAKSLAPSEGEFIERLRNRRKALENGPDTEAALESQRDTYKWDAFLADLATYVNKNFEAITDEAITSIKPLIDNKITNGHVKRKSPSSRPAAASSAPPPSPPHIREDTPKLSQTPVPPPPPHYHFPPGPPPERLDHPIAPPHTGSEPNASLNISAVSGPSQPVQHLQQVNQHLANGAPMDQPGSPMPVFNGVPPYHTPPGPPGPPDPLGPFGPPAHAGPQGPAIHHGPPALPAQAGPPGPPGHHGPPAPPIHAGHPGPAGLPNHTSPPGPNNLPPPGFPGPHFHHGPPPSPMHHHYPPLSPHAGYPLPPGHPPPRMETPFIQHQYPPPDYSGPPNMIHCFAQHPSMGFHGLPPPPPGYMHAGIPNPSQTRPTAQLYEQARQVASAKSQGSGRTKASNVSQRRPWSTEEEQALMVGLDEVKGPHWSQILALHGSGGTMSEILKDRSQVQLKDKARNLKLFFLKAGIEVPYYLQFVTGELKSRAPGHQMHDENGVEIPADPNNPHHGQVMDFNGHAPPQLPPPHDQGFHLMHHGEGRNTPHGQMPGPPGPPPNHLQGPQMPQPGHQMPPQPHQQMPQPGQQMPQHSHQMPPHPGVQMNPQPIDPKIMGASHPPPPLGMPSRTTHMSPYGPLAPNQPRPEMSPKSEPSHGVTLDHQTLASTAAHEAATAIAAMMGRNRPDGTPPQHGSPHRGQPAPGPPPPPHISAPLQPEDVKLPPLQRIPSPREHEQQPTAGREMEQSRRLSAGGQNDNGEQGSACEHGPSGAGQRFTAVNSEQEK